jgi:hypothetical protein
MRRTGLEETWKGPNSGGATASCHAKCKMMDPILQRQKVEELEEISWGEDE